MYAIRGLIEFGALREINSCLIYLFLIIIYYIFIFIYLLYKFMYDINLYIKKTILNEYCSCRYECYKISTRNICFIFIITSAVDSNYNV